MCFTHITVQNIWRSYTSKLAITCRKLYFGANAVSEVNINYPANCVGVGTWYPVRPRRLESKVLASTLQGSGVRYIPGCCSP